MLRNLLRQPNFAVLVALAWLAVALVLLVQHWPQTAERLLDTDDAMRLVELRAWLAGQGWFDLREARLNPPLGYESHWSRLIDAGLGGLLALFKWYADPLAAERLMRATWPLLWLLPTIAGMAAVAWRIAGREAAMVALLLALVGVPAYQQFTPGRIDHHNVQIALTLWVVAAIAWSDRKRWAGVAAGLLSGLALAIGFESLPYIALCGAAMALRYVADRDAGPALRGYGRALAAAAVAGFLVSVGPDHWGRTMCDAIALNSMLGAVFAGLALAFVTNMRMLAPEQMFMRGLAVAGAGGLALAAFVLLEPRCIRGPFAMVDPGIWPVWHDHVRELQPLVTVFRVNPLTEAGIAAFPAFALFALLVLVFERDLRRNFGFIVVAVVFLAAAITTVLAIRGYSYAMWLGMPLVATLALRVFAVLRLRAWPARLIAGLFFTPMALSAGAITIAHATGLNDLDNFARPESRDCFRSASYAALARLPAGIIVTDTSYGPYLLALTPHAPMAAPYHRLGQGIVTAHRALTAPPDEARGILTTAKATYVMVCGPRPPDGLAEPARDRSLWARLRAGATPAWLEPMPGTSPFAVYRVRP
jgi:hypothetical protein